MAHLHLKTDVIDTDPHFMIDPDTRDITCKSDKIVLMQNDHNSERFTFEIPRYVDGHDMSLCNVVQVHYINRDSSNMYQNADIYKVDDIHVVSKSEDIVVGSWLVSMNATTFSGSLEFIVRFACVSRSSVIEYQWFSNICSIIRVERGIYNIDTVTNFEDRDVLEGWKTEILEEAMRQSTDLVKESEKIFAELSTQITKTRFSTNFETGNLEYTSPSYNFSINTSTGNLEWEVN